MRFVKNILKKAIKRQAIANFDSFNPRAVLVIGSNKERII